MAQNIFGALDVDRRRGRADFQAAARLDRALAVANEVGAQRMLRLGLRLAADLLGAELPAHLAATVQSDRAVAKLAAQIESRSHTASFMK